MPARSAAACRDRARRCSRCAATRRRAERVAAAMTAAVSAHIGGEPQTYVSPIAPHGAARACRTCAFVTTARTTARPPRRSFTTALFDGLAPDGGLYVPGDDRAVDADEIARLPSPHADRDRAARAAAVHRAARSMRRRCEASSSRRSNFPIPLVEVEPGIFALELFHGPTLAFKDVGARVMARLMAALHRGDDR